MSRSKGFTRDTDILIGVPISERSPELADAADVLSDQLRVHLQRRLETELHYKADGDVWLTAFSVDLRKSGISPGEAQVTLMERSAGCASNSVAWRSPTISRPSS